LPGGTDVELLPASPSGSARVLYPCLSSADAADGIRRRPHANLDMSESYLGAGFTQQALPSKRRGYPIQIAPKNRSISQIEREAAVVGLVRFLAATGPNCFT
jgi:hypothetical protein